MTSTLSSPLTLLGICREDPEGASALRLLLTLERPGAIALELSPAGLEFRRQHGSRLLETLEQLLASLSEILERPLEVIQGDARVARLRATLQVPYYYLEAQRCASVGTEVILVDEESAALARLQRLEHELLTMEGLRTYLERPGEGSLEDAVESQYRLARGYLRDPGYFSYHYGPAEREDLEERAAHMGQEIRGWLKKRAQDLPKKEVESEVSAEPTEANSLLTIVGWEQLVKTSRFKTLAMCLNAETPRRRLLR